MKKRRWGNDKRFIKRFIFAWITIGFFIGIYVFIIYMCIKGMDYTMTYSRQKLKEIAYQRQLIEDLEILANECPMEWANEIYKLKIHEAKLLYRELHPNHLEFKSEEELDSLPTKPQRVSYLAQMDIVKSDECATSSRKDKTADTFYFQQSPKSQLGKLLIKYGFAKIRKWNDRMCL